MSGDFSVWSAAAGGFALGVQLGIWARDCYWTGKAHSVTRACARGRFYRVTEEP